MCFKVVGWEWGRVWIDLAQGRHRWLAVVNAVMNLRVPYIQRGEFLEQLRTY
jgi:hypothetical protein